MRNSKLIFTVLLVLFCSCNNNSKSKTEKNTTSPVVENQSNEDFQSFLTRFQQDSVFQLERIEFPLINNVYELDNNYVDKSLNSNGMILGKEIIIDKEAWRYKNFVGLSTIISKISENEYTVELRVEDTGVSINYTFNINNGKWYLIKIDDEIPRSRGSCNNNSKTGIEKSEKDTTSLIATHSNEDFRSFFLTKFQRDSVFQLERIEFPISYNIYEAGVYANNSANIYDTLDYLKKEVVIVKEKWKYQNLTEYLKIISKISENEYKVELQIEDTGVSINYIFKIVNNKWYLVEIVDEST